MVDKISADVHQKQKRSRKTLCFAVIAFLFVWGLWGATARCNLEPTRSLGERIVRTVTFQPIESPQPTVTTQTIIGTAGAPGQPGTQGLQGIRGIAGVQGSAGSDGAAGAQGQVGKQGDQGSSGEKGNDGDPATDDQTLNFNPATYGLTIVDGNAIDLSVLAAPDADSDPTNEIQTATTGGGLFVATDNSLGLMTTCGGGEILKWDGATWMCDAVATTLGELNDVSVWSATAGDILVFNGTHWVPGTDADTTYTAGDGLALAGTMFSAQLAAGGGLSVGPSGLSLLNTCSNGQILKLSGSSWGCAADNATPNIIYRQQLTREDDVTIHSSFTPLLTDGAGTPRSLPITVVTGSKVGFLATFEFSSSLGTGAMTLGVVRDDNGDNDCGTTAGDGTRVGGLATEMIGVAGQAYTKTLSFVVDSPPTTSLKYQLCASTPIAVGAVIATDRSLRLEEVRY